MSQLAGSYDMSFAVVQHVAVLEGRAHHQTPARAAKRLVRGNPETIRRGVICSISSSRCGADGSTGSTLYFPEGLLSESQLSGDQPSDDQIP